MTPGHPHLQRRGCARRLQARGTGQTAAGGPEGRIRGSRGHQRRRRCGGSGLRDDCCAALRDGQGLFRWADATRLESADPRGSGCSVRQAGAHWRFLEGRISRPAHDFCVVTCYAVKLAKPPFIGSQRRATDATNAMCDAPCFMILQHQWPRRRRRPCKSRPPQARAANDPPARQRWA